MPRLRKGRALAPGATIGVAAPAFAVDEERLEAGEAQLRGQGFRVLRSDAVLARRGYLAGADALRAEALMALVADPAVDAILCARGGYGSQRIAGALDASRVRAAAKPLLGFSDVTTLLLWERRVAGLVGFHAPMLEREEPLGEEELESLSRALLGQPLPPLAGRGRGGGRAEGRLLGGSLTLLAASLGTPWEPDTRGAILLFEEIGEKPYALDRMISQLAVAGKLAGLAGIGVGHLVGCVDPKRSEPTADEVLEELLAPLGIPFVTDLPFGHRRPNLTWPVGVRAVIDGERGRVEIQEAGVSRS